ncbi:MAG: tetratricopeptide repeat protein [Flavobacteriales bacterium]|nr:tetratricopeptide repeat protein [Flavobacteriales bacterium]MCB9197030.1 tetratricopeptide repeat protein [Flavobacteriales bacterium]
MKFEQYWNKAQNYIKDGNFDDALSALDKAVEIKPHDASLLSERAVVIFHLGDKERALKELDYCVLLEPTNPYRYSSRAYIKASLKDIKGAIEDYEKCISLDSQDAIAYNNLGLLLESQGRIEQAKRNFNKADELEGILKERGITVLKEEDSGNSSNESVYLNEANSPSTWSLVKGVFTQKGLFKEYLEFVKNGLKIKEKK